MTAAPSLSRRDRSGPRLVSLRRHAPDLLALAAMLAVLGVVYRRLVVGRVLAGGDLQLYFYPYWAAVTRAAHELRLPLWNPHLFAGAPLAANSQVGLFYPLNWPSWALTPPVLSSVTRAVHVNLLLHIALAGCCAYALARRSRLGPLPAALVGTLYAGSGFLGVHVEHLNQLQALAWLPLLFLSRRTTCGPATEWRRALPHPLSVAALAMILLAGHTQMAFISAVGVGVVHVARWQGWRRIDRARRVTARDPASLGLWLLGLLAYAIAGLMAGIQVAPTLELAGLSARSGGLGWREAVSFSLGPLDLARAVLPAYVFSPVLPEGAASIGAIGLVLSLVGVWRAVHRRVAGALPWVLLGLAGLALALGGYNPLYLAAARMGLPGVAHFRAPARFLALYMLAASMLAGIGCQQLWATWSSLATGRRRWVPASVLLVGLAWELSAAATALPHAKATAPRAFHDLRPATAHLVAAARRGGVEAAPPRFISLSKLLFEVGDKAEITQVYGDALSPDALWSLLVATKHREVLSPNLPLAYAVPAVDGYDGGLLPTRHYIDFTGLLVAGGTTDGRLRENLSGVPEWRWLDLLGVGYVVTDKTGDAWIDGVLFDRQLQPHLVDGATLNLAWLPDTFAGDSIGILADGGDLTVVATLATGERVATVTASGDGSQVRWVQWAAPTAVMALTVHAQGAPVRVQGVSLVDTGTGAFYPLTVSDHLRLAHSGDVKVYEAVTRPVRARFVPSCVVAGSPEAALDQMQASSFDPSAVAVLEVEGETELPRCSGHGSVGEVTLSAYAARSVVAEVHSDGPGVLLLADAWYPGWRATAIPMDGAAGDATELPVYRADVAFRGVPLEAGDWRVTFHYESQALRAGAVITLVGCIVFGLYSGLGRRLGREDDLGKTVSDH